MMDAITRPPVDQARVDAATREFIRKVVAGKEADLFKQLYEHTKEAIHKSSLEKLDAYMDRHSAWVSDLIATADAIQAGEGDQAAILGGLLTESAYAGHADAIFCILGFIWQWGQLKELMKDPDFLLPSFVNLSRIAANIVSAHASSEGVVTVASQVANGLAFGINVATYAYEVGAAGSSESLREAVEDAVEDELSIQIGRAHV